MHPGCRDSDSSKTVLFYTHENSVFDNFSAFQVFWGGILWPTVEHAYQATKFTDPVIISIIRETRSPYEAKRLARVYKGNVRVNWLAVELTIMEDILRAKLAQHEYVQRKLIETGDAELVEDSPSDSFWGRGPDWKGQNQMGKLWMKLRDELREKI